MLERGSDKSVYLYDKSQRELYLQELSLDKCPHEVQVYSLIDLEEGESRLEKGFWKSHLKTCKVCREKAQKIYQQMSEVESLIPEPELDQEKRERWTQQMKELISGSPLDHSLIQRLKTFWLFSFRPGLHDLWLVLRRPGPQFGIWFAVAWFILSR